eukprot:CAMPEP_0178383798 /NCGR_PEP_ID=MMETSP0689_2-20121128/7185_1 /TAXON_ID=160604 /ORGANISM="Amphidinium massartii, Strain CS-259" /LENGTH=575 /DNA_ID=CAMNT_0020004025 /DNA_START=68 /DNA_END=1792 /DNA_ORIENTATION=-
MPLHFGGSLPQVQEPRSIAASSTRPPEVQDGSANGTTAEAHSHDGHTSEASHKSTSVHAKLLKANSTSSTTPLPDAPGNTTAKREWHNPDTALNSTKHKAASLGAQTASNSSTSLFPLSSTSSSLLRSSSTSDELLLSSSQSMAPSTSGSSSSASLTETSSLEMSTQPPTSSSAPASPETSTSSAPTSSPTPSSSDYSTKTSAPSTTTFPSSSSSSLSRLSTASTFLSRRTSSTSLRSTSASSTSEPSTTTSATEEEVRHRVLPVPVPFPHHKNHSQKQANHSLAGENSSQPSGIHQKHTKRRFNESMRSNLSRVNKSWMNASTWHNASHPRNGSMVAWNVSAGASSMNASLTNATFPWANSSNVSWNVSSFAPNSSDVNQSMLNVSWDNYTNSSWNMSNLTSNASDVNASLDCPIMGVENLADDPCLEDFNTSNISLVPFGNSCTVVCLDGYVPHQEVVTCLNGSMTSPIQCEPESGGTAAAVAHWLYLLFLLLLALLVAGCGAAIYMKHKSNLRKAEEREAEQAADAEEAGDGPPVRRQPTDQAPATIDEASQPLIGADDDDDDDDGEYKAPA